MLELSFITSLYIVNYTCVMIHANAQKREELGRKEKSYLSFFSRSLKTGNCYSYTWKDGRISSTCRLWIMVALCFYWTEFLAWCPLDLSAQGLLSLLSVSRVQCSSHVIYVANSDTIDVQKIVYKVFFFDHNIMKLEIRKTAAFIKRRNLNNVPLNNS